MSACDVPLSVMLTSSSSSLQIQHDNTVTWLAHWKENINGNSKYVFLSAGSTWKGQSDRQKFEKARELQVSPAAFNLV